MRTRTRGRIKKSRWEPEGSFRSGKRRAVLVITVAQLRRPSREGGESTRHCPQPKQGRERNHDAQAPVYAPVGLVRDGN